jgi:Zn-dependent protease/predicted transcriptional regulator
MRGGIKVARLFGINIYIDWSWIFIFLLVTWNLAVAVFPTLHPDWGLNLTLGISVAASLLFFGSVLAHELAHSLVAKAKGLPVRRITLFIFGGAADIGKEPPSAGSEFLIAIVGPITSVVLGGMFLMSGIFVINGQAGAAGSPFELLTAMGPLGTLFIWLGSINILLGVFNMVPGFPLDGGRVLRSILWAITRNLKKATRWATFVGQLVAWGFIVTGVAMVFGFQVPIFGSGIIGGLWLAFIGWFLNNAAAASYQHVVVQDMLDGIPVSRLMRPDVQAVEAYIPLSALVYDHMIGSEDSAFPVVENDRLVGVISLNDVKKINREEWDTTLVKQVMTPEEKLVTTNPREEVTEALDKLTRKDVQQLPVVYAGQVVGLLRQKDIMRWLQLQSSSGQYRA